MVASYVQLVAERYQGQLDQDADEFIEYAVDGARRMQQLIEDLLAYSRVGTRGKAFKPTDCNSVVDEVIGNLRVLITEQAAVVTRDDLPVVRADRTQLVQLVQNLVGNAIKFRGEEPPLCACLGREIRTRMGVFASRTTGSESTPSTRIASSRSSSACIRERSIREPASDWQSAGGLWSGTAAASGLSPNPARAPLFDSHSWSKEDHHDATSAGRPIEILLVEDNPGDVRLTQRP